MGCGLWVVGYGLWVVGCGLWVNRFKTGVLKQSLGKYPKHSNVEYI
jgi:hypothetical protein